jgi:hypothetical protein
MHFWLTSYSGPILLLYLLPPSTTTVGSYRDAWSRRPTVIQVVCVQGGSNSSKAVGPARSGLVVGQTEPMRSERDQHEQTRSSHPHRALLTSSSPTSPLHIGQCLLVAARSLPMAHWSGRHRPRSRAAHGSNLSASGCAAESWGRLYSDARRGGRKACERISDDKHEKQTRSRLESNDMRRNEQAAHTSADLVHRTV